MRNTLQRAAALASSSTPIKNAITLALVAAPVAFASAPAQAATTVTNPTGVKYVVTVTGFTDAFAPGNWANVVTGSGASTTSFNASNLQLSKTTNQAGSVTRSFLFNQSVLDALRPTGAGDLLTGTYSYDYSLGGNTNRVALTDLNDAQGNTILNPPVSGTTSNTIDPASDTTFGFQLSKAGTNQTGIGTATISNFAFVAEYAVPGPLPLLGAATAFAWSRKLRNRLKSASSLA